MRIALLTIWHEKNYGAELQAYATIKVLQNLGHNVQMINIHLSDMKKKSFKQRVVDIIAQFGQDEKSFNRFWKKNIPTTRRYATIAQLKNNPPKADVYIVGSDQVWNPDITKDFAPLFFLNFGPMSIHRVAFASSFGTETWLHNELNEYIRSQLQLFSSISCREESGVSFLDKEFGLTAKCVLDPTLLLNDYSDLTGPIHDDRTLVYYPLSHDEELQSYSILLAGNLGLKPININSSYRLFNRIPWRRTSIEDWVRNIAQAQFVITRSFHGLVFCLLYKRQFAILNSRNGRGNRLVNLLRIVGLQDRFYPDITSLDKDKPWERAIDYSVVYSRLEKKRKDSILYISNTLNLLESHEKSTNGILRGTR